MTGGPCKATGREDNPRAYEDGAYPWSFHRVPRKLQLDGKEVDHPGRTCGIFVVHGMGEQAWTETGVLLRSGFEDALGRIASWQSRHPASGGNGVRAGSVPPPFIGEGYWANYEKLEATFPEDWRDFNENERTFYSGLWKVRTQSLVKVLTWFVRQQLGLLSPRVLFEVGPLAWLLYFPLQLVSLASLALACLLNRKVITGFLGDVRIYVQRRSMVEKAIVQRIDEHVGEAFLRMIGLDWEFRDLAVRDRIKASGEPIVFERVLWIAHSLGTVVSYNVLSDLFHRAEELSAAGDPEQKRGVARFRASLRRFVTMGSPLDKVAFLFPGTLRPWPQVERRGLVEGGETLEEGQPPEAREWWINFYHVLDPVSGALTSTALFGDEPPANFHVKSGCIPGYAHLAYWEDKEILRYILGRTYGRDYLRDKEYRPWPHVVQQLLGAFGYVAWAAILFGLAFILIERPEWLWDAYKKVKALLS